MNRGVIFLAGMILLCGWHSSAAADCSDSTPLSLALRLGVLQPDGTTVSTNDLLAIAGMPIVAVVDIRNVGTNGVIINTSELQLQNLSNGVIPVIESGEGQLRCPFLLPTSPMMNRPFTLEANQSITSAIVISSYFPGLGKPGEYKIRAKYFWPYAYYYDIAEGRKKTCVPLDAVSDEARLVVMPIDSVGDLVPMPAAVVDGDVGVHFAYALANLASDESIILDRQLIAGWGRGVMANFVARVRALYPERYGPILIRLFSRLPKDVIEQLLPAWCREELNRPITDGGQPSPE